MSVRKRLSWDARANFLCALDHQKAHWYAILLLAASGNLDDHHCLAFPLLLKLTSVGEEIIRDVLCQCGLVWYVILWCQQHWESMLNASKDYIYAPRLCISSQGNEFANNLGDIGTLASSTVADDARNYLSVSDSDDTSIDSTSHSLFFESF